MGIIIYSYWEHHVNVLIKGKIATMSTKDIVIPGKEDYEVTEILDFRSGVQSSFTVDNNTNTYNRYPGLDSHSSATFTFVDDKLITLSVINNDLNLLCKATVDYELGVTYVTLKTFDHDVVSDSKSYQIDHAITAGELKLLTREMKLTI